MLGGPFNGLWWLLASVKTFCLASSTPDSHDCVVYNYNGAQARGITVDCAPNALSIDT